MAKLEYKNQIFAFDFKEGGQTFTKMPVPVGPVSLVKVLPNIFSIADDYYDKSLAMMSGYGKSPSCGPACGVCCNQLVSISMAEAAYLLNLLETFDPARKIAVLEKFTAIVKKCEETGLLSEIMEVFLTRLHDGKAVLNVQKKYFDLGMGCPFREQGSCSIYPHRPLICRQYLVSSDPANCASVYSGANIEKIIHNIDLAGAIAAFDGNGPSATRAVPLSLILFRKSRILTIKWPKLEGAKILAIFFNYASQFYRNAAFDS